MPTNPIYLLRKKETKYLRLVFKDLRLQLNKLAEGCRWESLEILSGGLTYILNSAMVDLSYLRCALTSPTRHPSAI